MASVSHATIKPNGRSSDRASGVTDNHTMHVGATDRRERHVRAPLACTRLFLALVLVLLMVVNLANANNFYGATGKVGCSSPNAADNGDHTFYYDASVPGYMRDAVGAIRVRSLNPTDMNTSTVTSVTANTDVVTYQHDYTSYCGFAWNGGSGGGVWGLTTCVSLTNQGRCQKHEMRFDTSYVGPESGANRRALACHETGHTLGLAHRGSGGTCMVGTARGSEVPDAHDVAHLDAEY